MDGRDRWMDDLFIERLRRSLKHQDVDLESYIQRRIRGEARHFRLDTILQRAAPASGGVGYRAPMALWRTQIESDKAVDIVDNSCALPTCL
jgi:putative transposase